MIKKLKQIMCKHEFKKVNSFSDKKNKLTLETTTIDVCKRCGKVLDKK